MSTERVTFRPEGGRARTILLRDAVESGPFLTGIEVNAEGDEVAPRGVDERRHIIDAVLILRRQPVVMDRLYGVFVDAGTESTDAEVGR